MEKLNLYRRNGKKVYIKQPTFEELENTARLWNDRITMADIGGVYSFPEAKWGMFYKKMVSPSDGKNFYCHVYNVRDKFIGEVSFHGYDSLTKAARVNVKIHHRERGKGYAEEAIKLLLEYYFFEFCGTSIIDTTDIEGGKKLLNKLGFESIGQFKSKETFKMSKTRFLSYKPATPKNVVIIAYDDMKDVYYSTIEEVFSLANRVSGEEKFILTTVSKEESINIGNKILYNNKSFDLEIKPDILIIPGGDGSFNAVKDKDIIKYILTHYNDCDYLLSIEKSILFLNRCRMLDGILIPNIKGTEEELSEASTRTKFVDKAFLDYGKIMISSNLIGTIEACLILVKKILGEECFRTVEKELGI